MMEKFLVALVVVVAVFGVSAMTYAYPTRIFQDEYWGDRHNSARPDADVIGLKEKFDTKTIEVSITDAGWVTVDIFTNFVGNEGTLGAEPGDLFISTNGLFYGPNAGSAPEYTGDRMHVPGGTTDWEYVMEYQTAKLYSLSGVDYEDAIITSDEPGGYNKPNCDYYRCDHEVLVDATKAVDTTFIGGFDRNTALGYYRFEFGLANIGITDPLFKLGLHWAPTCANDVFEVEYDPIPEPSTVLLIGLGLLGLVGIGRKRMKK